MEQRYIERGSMPDFYRAIQFTGDNCEDISRLERHPHYGGQIHWKNDTREGGWVRTYGSSDLDTKTLVRDREDAFWEANWREFSRGDWIIADSDRDLQVMTAKAFDRDYEPWAQTSEDPL